MESILKLFETQTQFSIMLQIGVDVVILATPPHFRPAHLRADPLGLIIIEPQCGGDCSIDLTYDGGTEARWTRVAQLAGVALCFVWPLARRRTS